MTGDADYVYREQRGDDRLTSGDLCQIYECYEPRQSGSYYCVYHTSERLDVKAVRPSYSNQEMDTIKIGIEQSAKGARVTISLLQTDHDIDTAVKKAVAAYKQTLVDLKAQELKVDE